jgi:hypothetical protein
MSAGFGEYSTSAFYPDNQRLLLASNFHSYLPVGNKSIEDICRPGAATLEQILSRERNDASFEYDLFEVNSYGNILRRLTTNNHYTEGSISSDGQWIAYLAAEKNTTDNLYLMNLNGTELRKVCI